VSLILSLEIIHVLICNFEFRVTPFPSTTVALQNLSRLLKSDDLGAIIEKLNPVTLNYVLYRCKEEEGSIYAIPNYGELVYGGLQGIASILDSVSFSNDLGHAICCNLRNGKWLMGKLF
jgi:glycogen debranching enzyme